MEVKGPTVRLYASSFDQESSRHGRVVEQALNEAKRQVEQGKDVVILLDSLTRLARAHNVNSDMWSGPRNSRGGFGSRTLSGGIDAHALEVGRHVFGAARTLEEGGSLTIVASCLVETGSRLDEVVYEEFKGTGNLEIHLSRELADRRIFPAIDLASSSTRQEERLLSATELRAMSILRRKLADIPKREGIRAIASPLREDTLQCPVSRGHSQARAVVTPPSALNTIAQVRSFGSNEGHAFSMIYLLLQRQRSYEEDTSCNVHTAAA